MYVMGVMCDSSVTEKTSYAYALMLNGKGGAYSD